MTGATSIHDNQGETVIRPPVFEADHPDVTGLPERVQAVVLDAFRTAPQAGQLWRITWADLPPRLGLVLDVGDSYTVMAPVTLDADRRVDAAMLIHDTPLGATAVAWPQVRTGMGDFALAECYGSVDADTLQAARARARVRTGNDDLDAWNAGLDDAEVLARRAYRDRLAAEFTALCDSDWNHADLHDEPEVFIDADLARKAGLTMRALAEIADLPDAAAYTVWRGEHPLPPDAQTALVTALGETITQALRVAPTDPGARAALDTPEVRERIAAVAENEQVTETDVRRDLYRDLVAAPGREIGERAQRDYRQRLQMLLDSRLS